MEDTLRAVIGAAAAIINVLGFMPYIRDILRHKTKPERAMWWIYVFMFGVLFAAQMDAGGRWLLLITGAYLVESAVIAMLSVRYGYGSFHKRDTISLLVAAVGLLLWLATDMPLVAIMLVIIVDFAGFWLTLVKTWHAPHTETLISWQLACVSAILSMFSISTWKLDIVVYPLYAAVVTALLAWLIMHRRTKVTEDLPDF
jgi:hypothetical protein